MTPPTYGQRVISRQQFRTELGDAVRIAINVRLQGTDPSDAQVRAELQDLKDAMTNVSDVARDDPATISGVQLLESLAFITAQEATDLLYIAATQDPPEFPMPYDCVPAFYQGATVWARQATEEIPQNTQGPNGDVCAYAPDWLCFQQYGGFPFVATTTELSFPSV
jgi:hypothetical protein